MPSKSRAFYRAIFNWKSAFAPAPPRRDRLRTACRDEAHARMQA